MSHSRSLALFVAAALTAALAPAALASAAAPAKSDHAKAEHDRIVAYWTPERMKAAKPRDFVRQTDGSFKLAPTPKAKPTRPSGVSPSTVTGASWTKPGQLMNRTGKVYFKMGSGTYQCSGSVAEDGGATGRALVLTAAHCAYDEASKLFATDWLFIPDFDSSPMGSTDPTTCSTGTTLGCWTADALVVHKGYATAGGFNTQATKYDFAFAVVDPGGMGGITELDSKVGSYAVTTAVAPLDILAAFGYPAAGIYSGNDLVYCRGPIGQDMLNGNATWQLACNMTGGSSGGPWLKGSDPYGDGSQLGSLNSYGYSGKKYMYGPRFNSSTLAVHNVAKALAASGTPDPTIGEPVGTNFVVSG